MSCVPTVLFLSLQAIARIRDNNPYNTIVMIGDGITDLEAVQTSGGADLFIGYGGVVERPSVAAEAEWYVYDHAVLAKALSRYQVAVIGSGAFACAAARMIAQNTRGDDPLDEVRPGAVGGVIAGCMGQWGCMDPQGRPAGRVWGAGGLGARVLMVLSSRWGKVGSILGQ